MAADGTLVRRRRGRTGATRRRVQPDDLPEVVRQSRAERPATEQDTTVVITPTRTRADEQYVLLFVANFLRVATAHPTLTRTDLLVYFALAEAAAYGNAVSVPQRVVAQRIGVARESVSRSVARLIDAGLMFRERGATYINLTVLLRGRLRDVDGPYWDQMAESVRISREMYGDAVVPPVRFALPEDSDEKKNRV